MCAARQAVLMLCAVVVLAYGDSSDEWRSFPAQEVERFGCSVEQVTMSLRGEAGPGRSVYTAEAWATRRDGERWQRVIAEFPSNAKGRRKALAECADWMDRAEALVREAQAPVVTKSSK